MSGNSSENNLKKSEMIYIGNFQFDVKNTALFSSDWRPVSLRNQSAKVLAELAKSPGHVFSKDALVDAVWGATFVTDDSLVQCVKDIRKVLGDKGHKIIRTIPKIGYRLDANDHKRPSINLEPSVLIENIRATGNAVECQNFAQEFYEKLVLVMSPRTGVRIFTKENPQEPVDYVVQGRASLSGGRAKLFISLTEAKLRGNFFAENFESDLRDIEHLAENVARKISSVLRISVISHEGQKYLDTPDDQLEFKQLLSKAHYFYSLITTKDTEIARATMTVAVEKSPDDPYALAMLAHSTTQMYPLVIGDISEDEKNWSLALADQAVEIGPYSGFAFRTRGNLRLWLRGDHSGCRADCKRALDINPNFYLTHLTLATSEILTGNHLEGEQRINSFVCLTTIDWQYPLFLSLIGLARLLRGEKEAAIVVAKEAYERMPNTPWFALVYIASAATDRSIVQSNEFQKLVADLPLPIGYFRSMPFTNQDDVAFLEARLRMAGVAD